MDVLCQNNKLPLEPLRGRLKRQEVEQTSTINKLAVYQLAPVYITAIVTDDKINILLRQSMDCTCYVIECTTVSSSMGPQNH